MITNKKLNPALCSDFYQFTMLAAYIMLGRENDTSTFSAFYRKNI